MEKRAELVLLAAFVVFGALTLPYVFQESLWSDEGNFIAVVNRIREKPLSFFSEETGRTSYAYVPLLFSVLLPFNSFVSTRLMNLLHAAAGLLLTYMIGKKIASPEAGAAAALISAAFPHYVFFSVRSLTDVPVATATLATVYALIRDDDNPWRWGILVGSSILFSLFSKITGILSLGIVVVYMGYECFQGGFKQLKKPRNLYAFLFTGVAVVIFLANNLLTFGGLFFASPSKTMSGRIFTGSHDYYIKQAGGLFSWPVFLLGLLGAFLSVYSNEQRAAVTASAFAIHFLFFSLMVGEKVPRYILTTLPLAAVLASYGVWKLIKNKYAVLATGLLFLLLLPQARALTQSKAYTYTGFQEMGGRVAELDGINNFSKIYTQSTRAVRAFSGIETETNGGKLEKLPKNLSFLENQTRVLLQLDVWEYTGPDWVYPLSQEKLNRLLAINFTVVHVVERDYPTQQGLQKTPVGFLLVK